jgi:hypothetical protein
MGGKFGPRVFLKGYEIMQKYRGERFTTDVDLTTFL